MAHSRIFARGARVIEPFGLGPDRFWLAARSTLADEYFRPDADSRTLKSSLQSGDAKGRRQSAVSLGTTGDRFWSKVDKGPDCWLWTASTFKTGRGQFRVGVRNQQAHRVAWELTFRAPPLGLLRSRCGNLLCVRPDHQVVVERKVGATNLA